MISSLMYSFQHPINVWYQLVGEVTAHQGDDTGVFYGEAACQIRLALGSDFLRQGDPLLFRQKSRYVDYRKTSAIRYRRSTVSVIYSKVLEDGRAQCSVGLSEGKEANQFPFSSLKSPDIRHKTSLRKPPWIERVFCYGKNSGDRAFSFF